VKTLAAHISAVLARILALRLDFCGRRDGHATRGNVDFRHDCSGERQQNRFASRRLDFKNVTRPEIQDVQNGTESVAVFEHGGKADEIRVIELVLFGFGQDGTLDLEVDVAERFRQRAVAKTLQAGDEHVIAHMS